MPKLLPAPQKKHRQYSWRIGEEAAEGWRSETGYAARSSRRKTLEINEAWRDK
jgi:hypothetical protein